MFERFTDRARRAVVLAQEEARLLDHTYLGTEHLLLGLIHEREGVAARALDALGVSLEAARREVEELVGRGPGSQPGSGDLPFTPRSVTVFELAFREAQELDQNYIGTEHLLLGLIAEGGGVAAHVLEHLGTGLERVQAAVMAVIEGREVDVPAPAGPEQALAELLASERIAELISGAGADLDTLRRALAGDPAAGGPAHEHAGAPQHSLAIPGLEGFSPEGHHLLMHAHVAAYQHGHEALRPEHLLLAMFDVATGPVHEAIDDLGVSLGAVRERVLAAVPETDASPSAPIPITPECRTVLEAAARTAGELGRPNAGPGHVLLALLQEEDGLTRTILEELVGRPSAVKAIVEQTAKAEGGPTAEPVPVMRDDPGAYKH